MSRRDLEAKAIAMTTVNVAIQQILEERSGVLIQPKDMITVLEELTTMYISGNFDDLLDVAYSRLSQIVDAAEAKP